MASSIPASITGMHWFQACERAVATFWLPTNERQPITSAAINPTVNSATIKKFPASVRLAAFVGHSIEHFVGNFVGNSFGTVVGKVSDKVSDKGLKRFTRMFI